MAATWPAAQMVQPGMSRLPPARKAFQRISSLEKKPLPRKKTGAAVMQTQA